MCYYRYRWEDIFIMKYLKRFKRVNLKASKCINCQNGIMRFGLYLHEDGIRIFSCICDTCGKDELSQRKVKENEYKQNIRRS